MSGCGPHDGTNHGETHSRKPTQSPPREDICCIFVHAGAGYHSIQNERIHLDACNDAAQVAMLLLRNGGTAVDAVEMAIKILEDREITNAGYGSNLAMDGVVECDASIVDHHGRSGAVGAVAQIKNPISLARLVLNHTMQPLTLRRVPPNLLVSQGATDFAYEMGIPVLPYDALISPAARERWQRWRQDLKSAERKAKKAGNPPSSYKVRKDPEPSEEQVREKMRRQHEIDMLQESPYIREPDENTFYTSERSSSTSFDPSGPSPSLSDVSAVSWQSEKRTPTPDSSPSEEPRQVFPMATPHTVTESSRHAFINSTQKVPTLNSLKNYQAQREQSGDHITEDTEMKDLGDLPKQPRFVPGRRSYADGSDESDSASSAVTMKAPRPLSPPAAAINSPLPETPMEKREESPTPRHSTPLNRVKETAPLPPAHASDKLRRKYEEDDITDTVGAIAIDSWGRIACGASSGGIGMKYRGRVGPAALVGIGTAVIPARPDDAERTAVATVTSGTGEHMATTMAATVCAERLYHAAKKGKGGTLETVTEDEALKEMIENEFMGHPSVRNSNSAGAIGILGIKKVHDGVFLYFGHNTDSFAMASMHSDEAKPWCAMSRSSGNGQVAQGGRMLKYRAKKRRTAGPQR